MRHILYIPESRILTFCGLGYSESPPPFVFDSFSDITDLDPIITAISNGLYIDTFYERNGIPVISSKEEFEVIGV